MAKEKEEILLGYHSVAEALKADRRQFHGVLLAKSRRKKRADKILDLAEKAGVPVSYADANRLDKLAGSGVHQGIVARTGPFPVLLGNELGRWLKQGTPDFFVLVLEQIEDPHNLGALIRTALCAGVDGIVIPKDRAALPSPTVSRTSAGAMEHAQIFVVTNTAATLKLLKENGAWVAGLDAAGQTPIFEADFKGPLALVVGGEHKGIRPGVQKVCDFLVSIPLLGPVSSLNASVAGGMAMYEALRQRSG